MAGLVIQVDTDLARRYQRFIETCSDPNGEQLPVFSKFTQDKMDEVLLIRELSVELQAKKDEDMRKAAEATAEVVESQETEKEDAVAEENQVSDVAEKVSE